MAGDAPFGPRSSSPGALAPPLLIAVAGLPGVGKSTLARALAARLGGPAHRHDRAPSQI